MKRETIMDYLRAGLSINETAKRTGAMVEFVRDCELDLHELERMAAEPAKQADWGEDSAFYANQR